MNYCFDNQLQQLHTQSIIQSPFAIFKVKLQLLKINISKPLSTIIRILELQLTILRHFLQQPFITHKTIIHQTIFQIMESKSNKTTLTEQTKNYTSLEMSFQDPLNVAFVEEDSNTNLDSSKSFNLEDISTISVQSSIDMPSMKYNPNISFGCNVSSINPHLNSTEQQEDQSIVQMLGLIKNDGKTNVLDYDSLKNDNQFKKKRANYESLLNLNQGVSKMGISKTAMSSKQIRQQQKITNVLPEKDKYGRYLKRS